MADHADNHSAEDLNFDYTAGIDEGNEENIVNIDGTDDDEHLDNVEPGEFENDFDEMKDQHIDISKITEKLNHEDSVDSNRLAVGRSLLHMTLLFLFLWASFYGIPSTALNHLIQYISHLFTVMASNSPVVVALMAGFPPSLYMAQKYFSLKKTIF